MVTLCSRRQVLFCNTKKKDLHVRHDDVKITFMALCIFHICHKTHSKLLLLNQHKTEILGTSFEILKLKNVEIYAKIHT